MKVTLPPEHSLPPMKQVGLLVARWGARLEREGCDVENDASVWVELLCRPESSKRVPSPGAKCCDYSMRRATQCAVTI
eukprot:3684046-Prymnesium_polylepis.1